jgi:hypothetical protein
MNQPISALFETAITDHQLLNLWQGILAIASQPA